jgi:hypothetical protein
MYHYLTYSLVAGNNLPSFDARFPLAALVILSFCCGRSYLLF